MVDLDAIRVLGRVERFDAYGFPSPFLHDRKEAASRSPDIEKPVGLAAHIAGLPTVAVTVRETLRKWLSG
jgi:hypothetical protein